MWQSMPGRRRRQLPPPAPAAHPPRGAAALPDVMSSELYRRAGVRFAGQVILPRVAPMYNAGMMTGILPFVLLLLFGSACFAVGYAVARRSGLKRQSELSEALDDTAARYREAMHKQTEVIASKESAAEDWKGCYETMVQSYDSMKGAYEGMKQAAEGYEAAAKANRQAYDDMKTANESLLDALKGYKDSVPR